MGRWIFATLLLLFVGLLIFSCVKDIPISSQSQFKLDTNTISGFLTANKIIAQKAPGGFWYVIDSLDTGVLPVLTDSVRISFKEWVIPDNKGPISGHAADSSASDSISLSNAISAMQQGLLLFPVGSSGRLYVPSGLAFGSVPFKNIPVNSNLYYKIKLLAVKGTQLTSDISVIESYLLANVIKTQVDRGSGIHYVINAHDTSTLKPLPTDSIWVTSYTLSLLGATTPIRQKESIKISLNDQIAGLKIILPKVTENSTVTVYVPSGYAYGAVAVNDSIPVNSNLVYQLTLKEVIHH